MFFVGRTCGTGSDNLPEWRSEAHARTMPKYKLIYFDVRGRGEIPRLLFHYVGVKFEDKRLKVDSNGHCNEWLELKPSK